MARHYNNKYRKKSQETVFIVKEDAYLMEFLMKAMDGISRSKVKRMLSNDEFMSTTESSLNITTN